MGARKYTFEFKKDVVQAYLSGEGSFRVLAQNYNVHSYKDIHKWVQAYTQLGEDALKPSKYPHKYSFEFKLHVVQLYLTSDKSYDQVALSVGMNQSGLVTNWVQIFRQKGPDGLKEKRPNKVPLEPKKPRKSQKSMSKKKKIDDEKYQELLDENLKLRIENAYLKELRRLRLEEESRLNKKQGSSTVSEENSDSKTS